MADPYWPSKVHNGLVNPIMVWLNPGVKVKPRSQIINMLIVACSDTYNGPRPSALGYYGCLQGITKAIPLQAIINI